MHPSTVLIAAASTIAHLSVASAQQPRFDIAQPEHALLERLAGEWQYTSASSSSARGDLRRLDACVLSP